MGEPFREGEQVLLIDGKGRRYLVTLRSDRSFQYHRGVLAHADLIGAEEGVTVTASGGSELIALRPRLPDYILKMRRGAQVVYPKDIGPILLYGDIAPGASVLEAGTGSGALTAALVRAVGREGRVVSVERRSDHADHARRTLERWFGGIPANLDLRVGEVEEMVDEVEPDRIVLDVPEPWHTVTRAVSGLQGGGVLTAYVPTIPQVQQTVEALRSAGCFADISSFEVLIRTWNVEGRSVRPDHRMVGHTGFITVARKTRPA